VSGNKELLKTVGRYLVLLASCLALIGCGRPVERGAVGPTTSVPFVPEISINEIMVGQVDHAAHPLLGLSMASDLTIGAWQELEHSAIQLVSATTALTMGGSGVNDAMWVVQSGWREYAGQMSAASGQALTATRNQDLPALLDAADRLRNSCDNCHRQYKPEIPTEGFYRVH
jgi:hypothetical protein